MQAYAGVQIATKHKYELDHSHHYKCSNDVCGYVYGRWSKSIDVTKSLCGKCRGVLVYVG